MKQLLHITFLTLGIIIGFCLCKMSGCGDCKYVETHDTIPKIIHQVGNTIIDTQYIKQVEPFDTAAYLKDYLTKKTITQTFDDGKLRIKFSPVLFKNNIESSTVTYQNLIRESRKEKPKLFMGAYVSTIDGKISFAPSATFIHKNFLIGGYYKSTTTFGGTIQYLIHFK